MTAVGRRRPLLLAFCVSVFCKLPLSLSFLPPSSTVPNTRTASAAPALAALPISSDGDGTSPEEGIGVGIDLGTTHSAIAVLVDGIPTIVPIQNNGRTMPSVVSWDERRQVYLSGREAIENEANNPRGTYRNVKRILGTGGTMARETAEIVPNLVLSSDDVFRNSRKFVGKKKKKNQQQSLQKQIEEATVHPSRLYGPPLPDGTRPTLMEPELISSKVLQTLLDAARQHAGQPVSRAVVGVPAYFHDAQRDATIRACRLAGVDKVKLLREPEAAALAYGVGMEQIGRGDEDELVLVFDLGGGTFDVSMLLVGGGLTEVISTSGNVCLGGSDFDARIAEHLAKILQTHSGGEVNFLSQGGEAADAIVRAAEAVRIHLSNNRKAFLALPLRKDAWFSLARATDVIVSRFDDGLEVTESGLSNSTHVLLELSRKTMERLCRNEFQALLRPLREVAIMSGALLPGDARPGVVEAAFEMEEQLERAMQDAKGGTPIAFEDFYRDERGRELAAFATTAAPAAVDDVDPAMLLQLRELDLQERKRMQQKGRKKARDVAKRERKFRQEKRKIDTEADARVIDGISGRPISQVVLVGGATRMPAIGRLLAAMTGIVPQRTVNPDEAVALGCAVHVGVLDGNEALKGLTVLTPMQAAIMRAVAEKDGILDDSGDFDDTDFKTIEYY